MPARLAIDLDGVLCDFNKAYGRLFIQLTKENKFPRDWFEQLDAGTFPPTWNWELDAGYTKEQFNQVWDTITASGSFWKTLPPLKDASQAIRLLNKMANSGHNILFLTSRFGKKAKWQSERWLYDMGLSYPTVITVDNAKDKLPLIQHLGLDFFVDDKAETIISVAGATKNVNNQPHPVVEFVFLREAPYNQNFQYPPNVRRAPGILEALIEVYGN